LLRNPKKGGQGPTWAVEPYEDDENGAIIVDSAANEYVIR
jgi:hypothetical protein